RSCWSMVALRSKATTDMAHVTSHQSSSPVPKTTYRAELMAHRYCLPADPKKRPSSSTNHLFFSSRRRHTRSYGDWSSDVCSSDLHLLGDRDDAVPHELVDDRIGHRHRRPPTRITRLPSASTSRRSPGITSAVDACSSTRDRKSTRLNSSHRTISYAVFCLKKKRQT